MEGAQCCPSQFVDWHHLVASDRARDQAPKRWTTVSLKAMIRPRPCQSSGNGNNPGMTGHRSCGMVFLANGSGLAPTRHARGTDAASEHSDPCRIQRLDRGRFHMSEETRWTCRFRLQRREISSVAPAREWKRCRAPSHRLCFATATEDRQRRDEKKNFQSGLPKLTQLAQRTGPSDAILEPRATQHPTSPVQPLCAVSQWKRAQTRALSGRFSRRSIESLFRGSPAAESSTASTLS